MLFRSPSLLHNQFRYYEIDGTPIGFVNWAWLDEETEEKYKTGDYELALDEWVGGSSLWFPEFVAPYGHARRSEERRVGKECRSRWSPYH